MSKIKINEQIVFLRKLNGLTQEDLANILGVSNQAVSKWETGQSCPDIHLLPEIARIFNISIDELLGYKSASLENNFILNLKDKIYSLSDGADYDFIYRIATALHTILYTKEILNINDINNGWDIDDAILRSGNAEWGYSSFNTPKLSTTLRQSSLFFSNNKNIHLNNTDIHRIILTLQPFCDITTFNIALTLYQLTIHSEDAYASISAINEKSNISKDTITNILDNTLLSFILYRINHDTNETEYRFKGQYMHLIPLLSLFDIKSC